MTEPGSSERSKSGAPKTRGGPSPSSRANSPAADASSRQVAATLVAGITGAAAFAVLVFAGLLLYQRMWGNSTTVLAVLAVLFGAGGLYAGWIAATMVFAAVRGGGDA